jgi:hypothetical protein
MGGAEVPDRIASGVDPLDLFRPRFTAAERESLRKLAESPDPKARRRCVDYLDQGLRVPSNRRIILELAGRLITDRSRNVRWGIALRLGWLAEEDPGALWPLIEIWGSAPSKDIRRAIACCVLEHALDVPAHFPRIFEKCRKLVLGGNRRFAFTLSCCHPPSRKAHARRFAAFLASLDPAGLPGPGE